MANNTDDEQRAQRKRRFQIDRITAQYVSEWRAGRSPKIEEYVQRYPDYESELLEFALTYHTVDVDVPEPDTAPAAVLSPAAHRALARIRESVSPASAASAVAIEGLVKQGMRTGYTPATLATAVGLTSSLLAKLEAHAIAAATIPRTLIERFSQALGVAPDAIAAFLGARPATQAGAFYYADQAPEQRQESFLEAVQSSDLTPDAKQVWEDITRRTAE